MDTRSKKYRFAIGFKVLAWALCVVGACGAVFTARAMGRLNVSNSMPQYVESVEFGDEVESLAANVGQAVVPVNEDTLKSEVDSYVAQLETQRVEELNRLDELVSMEDVREYEAIAGVVIGGYGTVVEQDLPDAGSAAEDSSGETAATQGYVGENAVEQYKLKRIEEINGKYAALIENAEDYIAAESEKNRESLKREIENKDDFYYAVIQDGVMLETNVEEGGPMNTILSQEGKYVRIMGPDGDIYSSVSGQNVPQISDLGDDTIAVYIAMKPDVFEAQKQVYEQNYIIYNKNVAFMVVCIGALIFGFVWLMATAGRTMDGGGVKLLKTDAIFLDVGFVLMIIAVLALIMVMYANAGSFYGFINGLNIGAWGIAGIIASIGGIISVILLWSMSLARRAKRGDAGQHTLIYSIFSGVDKLYKSAGVKPQAVLGFIFYTVAGIVCAAIMVYGLSWWDYGATFIGVVLMVVYIVASLVFAMKRAGVINDIRIGVEEIKNGNMDYAIPVRDGSEISSIATGINNIAEGLSGAVRKEVKSERMKTELITNISHDLKTPLTSILTYVDLLKKEEGLSGAARKYVDVLDMKSNRLKALTDDLFEAAKASSGDIAVNMTRIELVQFMEQAIGEMSDRISESGLAFITDIPEDKSFVYADGKLLFRVVSNVFDNVIKYALEGSRVYVSIETTDEHICVVVKNISKNELNITEDELMERFVRGDSSRNTEGSGLGLAIAKDFMKLMNGRFVMEIDGDLFKVRICMKKAE